MLCFQLSKTLNGISTCERIYFVVVQYKMLHLFWNRIYFIYDILPLFTAKGSLTVWYFQFTTLRIGLSLK